MQTLYYVIWVIATVAYVSCPEEGKKDEFGRFIPNTCTIPHHTEVRHDTITKMYTVRDTAFAYYNRVLQEVGPEPTAMYSQSIISASIDSTTLTIVENAVQTDSLFTPINEE